MDDLFNVIYEEEEVEENCCHYCGKARDTIDCPYGKRICIDCFCELFDDSDVDF